MDLNGTIRTIGLYQPFASLMLHNKIETRWVEEGKKPPFPLGVYLIYATRKEYSFLQFVKIAGIHNASIALKLLEHERTLYMGVPIGVGELKKVYRYNPRDLQSAATFVDHPSGELVSVVHNLKKNTAQNKKFVLWCLEFGPVKRLKYTFDFDEGKQGVGILSYTMKKKIVIEDEQHSHFEYPPHFKK